MRVLWTERRSKQSILKEINTEYSLERLILKLKFLYFGHLMQRDDSLEKTLMLGKIEGRRRGSQRMRWLDGTTYSMDISLTTLGWSMKVRETWPLSIFVYTNPTFVYLTNPGIKPASFALAGRLLTTGTPEKPNSIM